MTGLSARSVALCGSQHRLPVALMVAEAERDELYAAAVALSIAAPCVKPPMHSDEAEDDDHRSYPRDDWSKQRC